MTLRHHRTDVKAPILRNPAAGNTHYNEFPERLRRTGRDLRMSLVGQQFDGSNIVSS
jgi:hypothetical protein